MTNIARTLARCGALTVALLGGAAASEAAPITLVNGASHVDLCLPGASCGGFGLSNWVADGNVVPWFQQSFTGFMVGDPGLEILWAGPLENLTLTPTITQTSSSASVQFFDIWQKIGITIDYQLAELDGVSHIFEHATVNNASNDFMYAGLSDGMKLSFGPTYVISIWDHEVDWTLASADYTPTPEPVSMVLLGTGLLAVARSRRRSAATA